MLLTNMVNIVPLDQLLPYSSRRVTVTFAYTDNRGEHANRAKSGQRSVQGLRPEGAKGLSPGFQPWVLATQKCALKAARE